MARKNKSAEQPTDENKKSKKKKKRKEDGRLRQMWQVFQMTRRFQPSIVWWMLGTFVLVMGAAVGIGFAVGHPVYLSIIGFPFGLLGALIILSRRAEVAAYARIEGQPGAAGAALGTIRRGWTIEEQPVAIDPRTQDMVFRAIGRPGVVLIGEGPHHRIVKLLTKEEKRVMRLIPNVPVLTFEVGSGEGQIPLPKIATTVKRQKSKLTKQEAHEVMRRLQAIGGMQLPMPKGIDPMRVRPDRKAMRGR